MLVSFIIPVYGQWLLTKNCLLSLKIEVNVPFEVILIDNGAKALADDETRIEAPILGKRLFGDNFVYLPQEKNINFAGASNLGAKVARSPLLFFLNNDTVVHTNFLPALIEELNNTNKLKMVAPVLEYPNNTIQHIGVFFTPNNSVGHLYEHFPINHRTIKRKRELQCITGAAFLMKKNDFLDIGAFNEEFINGFEDVDLCARMKRKGAELKVVANTLVTHYCSQSIGRHDKTKYNEQILINSGNAHYFKPDWHTFLINDGYELRFASNRRYIPELNAKLNASFQPLIQENNLEKMQQQFEKEPYWRTGFYAIFNHKDLDNEDRKNFVLKSHYLKTSKNMLYFMFNNYEEEEIKSYFAEEINNYLIVAKENRLEMLHENYKNVSKLSAVMEADCASHIKNCASYLKELEQWERNVMPNIEKYL